MRRVVMRRPGPATFDADPALWHYTGRLDATRLAHQYDLFVGHIEHSGAEIEWIPEADDGLADSIFVFDPSFMTPHGAIVLRPAKTLRRPEAALHETLCERLGVPVIGTITEPGTAEGGDLLWLDETTLVAGRGFRTNQAGIEQLRGILGPPGVKVHVFDLPMWQGRAACLHLLSGLSVNVLALGPRRCVTLAGFPQTLRTMKDAGCEVTCFVADALCLPCEGGPTCLTLPVWRG